MFPKQMHHKAVSTRNGEWLGLVFLAGRHTVQFCAAVQTAHHKLRRQRAALKAGSEQAEDTEALTRLAAVEEETFHLIMT